MVSAGIHPLSDQANPPTYSWEKYPGKICCMVIDIPQYWNHNAIADQTAVKTFKFLDPFLGSLVFKVFVVFHLFCIDV